MLKFKVNILKKLKDVQRIKNYGNTEQTHKFEGRSISNPKNGEKTKKVYENKWRFRDL